MCEDGGEDLGILFSVHICDFYCHMGLNAKKAPRHDLIPITTIKSIERDQY